MINGKEYYVSDESEENAKFLKRKRKFIGLDTNNNVMVFESDTLYHPAISYKFAVEIPEPKIIDWTYETCPLPPFTVKNKETGVYRTIITLADCYVRHVLIETTGCISFNKLNNAYIYIPDTSDRTKELPCGSVENG